eukprot:1177674-Rhodomonas_salina.1
MRHMCEIAGFLDYLSWKDARQDPASHLDARCFRFRLLATCTRPGSNVCKRALAGRDAELSAWRVCLQGAGGAVRVRGGLDEVPRAVGGVPPPVQRHGPGALRVPARARVLAHVVQNARARDLPTAGFRDAQGQQQGPGQCVFAAGVLVSDQIRMLLAGRSLTRAAAQVELKRPATRAVCCQRGRGGSEERDVIAAVASLVFHPADEHAHAQSEPRGAGWGTERSQAGSAGPELLLRAQRARGA